MLTFAALRKYLAGGLTLTVIVVLALLGLLVGRSWLAAHDAAVNLAATLKVQGQVLAQADERQHQRDASLAAALAQINAAKRRVTTPAQAVAEIPQVLPPLPQLVELQLPPPTTAIPAPPPSLQSPNPTSNRSTTTCKIAVPVKPL